MTASAVAEADRALDVRTARGLIVLQSRLLAPSYAGPGKWAIFDPETRRSFLAASPDNTVLPKVLRILLAAGEWTDPTELVGRSGEIRKLIDERVLVERGAGPSAVDADGGFLGHYQRATFDYPFLDYSRQDWIDEDRRIMAAYSDERPHPPVLTPLQGPVLKLPPPDAEALGRGNGDLGALATALHTAFAPIGEIDGGPYGPWLRKTSPSGGARHPIDGVVVLGRQLEGIPAGAYAYAPAEHGLVATHAGAELTRLAGDAGIAVGLRARVERAMWRYRDARALRPVLLDAGHVAETLGELLALAGWQPRLEYPRENGLDEIEAWLAEPLLAAIVDGAGSSRETTAAPVAPGGATVAGEDAYTTNPFMYIAPYGTGLAAVTVWPERAVAPLDERDLLVLTHCLPSRRDDRDTTAEGIAAAVAEADGGSVERLLAARTLQPRSTVAAAERAVGAWAGHGWYLSALAMLAGRADPVPPESRPFAQPLTRDPGRLFSTLAARRTDRAFTSDRLSADSFEAIVAPLLGSLGPVSLCVAALDVEGLDPGLHEWTPGGGWEGPTMPVSREQIRHWTIGQGWAAEGAAVLWLIRSVDPSRSSSFEPDIMDLGRLGQRICLAAAAERIGVFLTPALRDAELFRALSVADAGRTIAYSFTLGVARR
jgi:hypothetical protein